MTAEALVHEVEVRVGEQLGIGVVGPLDAEAVRVPLRIAAGGDGDDDDVVAAKGGPQQRRRGDAGAAEDTDDRWHQAPPMWCLMSDGAHWRSYARH